MSSGSKKYILPEKFVGSLATAVAVQEGKVLFEKDDESSFYIAQVEDHILIPDDINALEIQSAAPPEEDDEDDEEVIIETRSKFIDLMLRFELDESVNEEFVREVICQEINKAIETAMKKHGEECD